MSGHAVTSRGWSSSTGRLLAGIGAGVLSGQVPLGVVDEALEDSCGRQRRFRVLPSRLGVYFVLALCLFCDRSYGSVLDAIWGTYWASERPLAESLLPP